MQDKTMMGGDVLYNKNGYFEREWSKDFVAWKRVLNYCNKLKHREVEDL
jgi:hypothetical protein